jgi:branched-chain amino acid transport system ATP-binding protein/neutral amino acid transport system ATP-binding protein
MRQILEVKNIGKSFNGLEVLKNVSFSLSDGSISALFGENGSGKTTLFHIISGFLKANTGGVFFNGQNLSGMSPVEISRSGIGRVWQSPRICKNISVSDNLILASKDHPGETILNYLIRPFQISRQERRRKERACDISGDLRIADVLNKPAGSLSFGQQKLLSIGMLLMNDAELLILDEPFAGVNPVMIEHLSEVLVGLKKKGKTICMIEHNRTKAISICDKTLLLSRGIVLEEVISE